MNIVLGKENAEQLKEKNIVLELDTFNVSGKDIVAYCVLGLEDVPLNDLPQLDHTIKLHQTFVGELKNGNKKFCQELGESLMKAFNGLLAEYYSNSIKRLNQSTDKWNYAIIK